MALWDGLDYRYCPSLDDASSNTLSIRNLDGSGVAINADDGVLKNMVTSDWEVNTEVGGVRALNFDGINDHLRFFDMPYSEERTFTFWVKQQLYGVGVVQDFLIKRHAANTNTLSTSEFIIANSGTSFGIQTWPVSGTSEFVSVAYPASPLNAWTHLAIAIDAADIAIYINGAGTTLTNPFSPRNDGNAELQFAAANAGTASRWFGGLMDDLCIFSQAKPAADIALLASQRGYRLPAVVRRRQPGVPM